MQSKSKFWQKGEFYFVLLLLCVTLYFVIESTGFPKMAQIFPLVVGSAALLIIVVDVLQLVIPKFGDKFARFRGGELFTTEKEKELAQSLKEAGKSDTAEEEGGETLKESESKLILKTFAWFLGAFVLFYLFGYLVFAGVFLFLFLKVYAHQKFLKSFLITAVFTLFVWLAFSQFLRLDTFAGSALF